MGLKVTYTHPAFPDDYEFDVYGVGLVTNGEAKELTAEEEQAAVGKLGMPVRDYLGESEDMKVEGTATVKAADIPPPPEEVETTQVIDPEEEEGGES
jgi:hypothetical protein